MSGYPEDVMKAARGIVANIRADFTGDGRIDDATAEEEEERVAHAIARAIMAERQRCADIARSTGVYPELNVFGGGPEWYRHGKAIAKAITSPPSSSASSSPAHPSEQEPDRRPCS